MYVGHCDSSVYSVLQNKIPDDGGDYYLYQKAAHKAPLAAPVQVYHKPLIQAHHAAPVAVANSMTYSAVSPDGTMC